VSVLSRLFEPRRSFASVVRELVEGLEAGRVVLNVEPLGLDADAAVGQSRHENGPNGSEPTGNLILAVAREVLAKAEQVLAEAEKVRTQCEAIRDEIGKSGGARTST
jgi:hypothetical protein